MRTAFRMSTTMRTAFTKSDLDMSKGNLGGHEEYLENLVGTLGRLKEYLGRSQEPWEKSVASRTAFSMFMAMTTAYTMSMEMWTAFTVSTAVWV